MAYTVTITYTPANDILNAKSEPQGIVSAVSIPGLTRQPAPSDQYIYAPANAAKAVYNAENVSTIDANGNIAAVDKYKDLTYLTSGQKRWAKAVTDAIYKIIEAYATPQVPVYRAWQTFKLAIAGGSISFETANYAEADFYKDAGKALTLYGIAVTVVAGE